MSIILALVLVYLLVAVSSKYAINWRSPLTYVIILVIVTGLRITGLIIPLLIATGLAWYFSPKQIMRREYKEREEIRADALTCANEQAKERSYLRKQAIREKAYERTLQEKERKSAVYQKILQKKTERNNVISQTANLYNTAKTLKNRKAPAAETNAMFNQIAELKQQKITLSQEIDDLYLDMHRSKTETLPSHKGKMSM